MPAFTPNPNFERELAGQTEYQRGLLAAAKPLKAAVESVAPHRTGYYARSIEVVEVDGRVVLRTTDPFGHLIEFGSSRNPPFAPLRRGVRAAGLKFEESPKE